MKVTSLLAAAAGLALAEAYVVDLYADQNCNNYIGSRNVYDNTCAYTQGFQSFIITTYGGGGQAITAFSRQACAGPNTFNGCAQGSQKNALNYCFAAYDSNGGSNALSSYSDYVNCPN